MPDIDAKLVVINPMPVCFCASTFVHDAQAKDEVKKLIAKAQQNELEAQPGRSMMESFENQVNQVLNKARDDAGRFAQNSLKDTNNVVRMVTAGSKGSFINISQVPSQLLLLRVDNRCRFLEPCLLQPTRTRSCR